MKNERGAGRKPRITEDQLKHIKKQAEEGESISSLAKKYGVSRQALYKRLGSCTAAPVILEYIADDNLSARIEIDAMKEQVHLVNYAARLSARPFGLNESPDWHELGAFLEQRFLASMGVEQTPARDCAFCSDQRKNGFSLGEVINSDHNLKMAESGDFTAADNPDKIQFRFEKKDILYARTDTDGFQLKALSHDRKWFVKAQAVISGKMMDDWAVELIASDLCRQLGIACVYQRECEIVYAGRKYIGVYAPNFELDGYTFISFESLINRNGYSTKDDEFIHLDTISKLKWCADRLQEYGQLDSCDTLKYMIDLALIDCLVGNTDRHTRNYGLFFNSFTGKYEIPLIFDCGMGLFQHDPYRDTYMNFDDAMRTVYVSPYGEDPFDMLRMLFKEFDMNSLYPDLKNMEYHSTWKTPFAEEYIRRIKDLVGKEISCRKTD